MNTALPNMRLICFSSLRLGEDWFELSIKIDDALPNWGMELADESVYLLFDCSPGAVMHGEGNCLVARSVIGPKRGPSDPYSLQDWVSSAVSKHNLSASSWPKVFEEAFLHWEKLQREGREVPAAFTLCLQRRLRQELTLEVQVIFKQ
jgi:hypothetical protein